MSNTVGSTFGAEYSGIFPYDGLNISDYHDSCQEEEGSGSPYPRNACECSNNVFYAERGLGIDCNLSRILYYYHPDYLGHNEYITDITGRPYRYFHYSAFGESLIEKNKNYGQFSSPYRFNGKELDPETGNYYYGARYYNPVWSVWLGVDPLAEKGAYITPYAFTHNNPVILVDPDGMWPGVGFGIGFRTNFNGGFSVSVAMGISQRGSDAMGSINMSLSAYNYGLGTTHGSTGNYSRQMDFVISPALTIGLGSGEGRALPLNTISNNMSTGVFNNFEGSGTVATNFVLNSSGRNQRVGFVGGKSGSASFGMYNDFIPGLGDKDDRWYTGGGNLTIASDFGNFMIGTDVFTGERLGKDGEGNWLAMPGNPAGGIHGTYGQSSHDQLLNNGQAISILPGINPMNFKRIDGKDQMGGQNFIHNHLTNDLLFYSTAN